MIKQLLQVPATNRSADYYFKLILDRGVYWVGSVKSILPEMSQEI